MGCRKSGNPFFDGSESGAIEGKTLLLNGEGSYVILYSDSRYLF